MTTRSPVGGPQGVVPLISALAVVAVLLAQTIVISVVGFVVNLPNEQNPGNLVIGPLDSLVQYLLFGIGVLVSLRYVLPVDAGSPWPVVVVRSIAASALGAAVLWVISAGGASIYTVAVEGHIFGDSFLGGTIDGGAIVAGIGGAFVAAVAALVQWLPLVIVVCGAQEALAHTSPRAGGYSDRF
jgi:hypothetical protein